MPKKILIVNGHPRVGSFSDALATAYYEGATAGGHNVELVHLRDLHFDPILREKKMPLEADLLHMQERMKWCDCLVVVTPMWWFGMPALLKGFFDRILTSGFAYKHTRPRWYAPWSHFLPKKLLKGRSARVIYTHDTMKFIIRFGFYDPFWQAIKWGTLWYSGFNPVRRTAIAPLYHSTEKKRHGYLAHVSKLGKRGK